MFMLIFIFNLFKLRDFFYKIGQIAFDAALVLSEGRHKLFGS